MDVSFSRHNASPLALSVAPCDMAVGCANAKLTRTLRRRSHAANLQPPSPQLHSLTSPPLARFSLVTHAFPASTSISFRAHPASPLPSSRVQKEDAAKESLKRTFVVLDKVFQGANRALAAVLLPSAVSEVGGPLPPAPASAATGVPSKSPDHIIIERSCRLLCYCCCCL